MLLRPEDGDEFVCPSCREVIESGTRINDNRALIAALEEAARVESSPLTASTPVVATAKAVETPQQQRLQCTGCDSSVTRNDFSKAQLAKGARLRRCKACVAALFLEKTIIDGSAAEPNDVEVHTDGQTRVAQRAHGAFPSAPLSPPPPFGSVAAFPPGVFVFGAQNTSSAPAPTVLPSAPQPAPPPVSASAAAPAPASARRRRAARPTAQSVAQSPSSISTPTASPPLPSMRELYEAAKPGTSVQVALDHFLTHGSRSSDVAMLCFCAFGEKIGDATTAAGRRALQVVGGKAVLGPALVRVMRAFPGDCMVQANACHLIGAIATDSELLFALRENAGMGLVLEMVRVLRICQDFDWSVEGMAETGTSRIGTDVLSTPVQWDDHECPLVRTALWALLNLTDPRVARSDPQAPVEAAVRAGAVRLAVAAISRVTVRASSDDETTAAMAVMLLGTLASAHCARGGCGVNVDDTELPRGEWRVATAHAAVLAGGGLEAIVAVMRAFDGRLKGVCGEQLMNIHKGDPMDEATCRARYKRWYDDDVKEGDCLWVKMAEAANGDKWIMDAVFNEEKRPTWFPPYARPEQGAADGAQTASSAPAPPPKPKAEPKAKPKPPAAVTTASSASPAGAALLALRVGHVVRINGLAGRPELNGHRGIVLDPPSSSNGRRAVHVMATGERVALLPERLSLDCPPPSAPLPSESDLRASDLVNLTTVLAHDGPRSMDACSMVCSELFRRANSAGRGSRGKQIRATLARLPIAAILVQCLQVHANEMARCGASGEVPKGLMSLCYLVSRLPSQAASASGLPAALCTVLTALVDGQEAALEAADPSADGGGDIERYMNLEHDLALCLSMYAVPALCSCVIDAETNDCCETGAKAVCSAGGADILVKLLKAASNAFADTLPRTTARTLQSAARAAGGRVTSQLMRLVGNVVGRAWAEDGEEEDGDTQQDLVLTMVFSQLSTSVKLLCFLADSAQGAEVVLASDAWNAIAEFVDWYPDDENLVDHWQAFLAVLLKHQPERQSQLLIEHLKNGLADPDDPNGRDRPTARLLMNELVENHGEEIDRASRHYYARNPR